MFRTGCPWELFYADDLVITATSEVELLAKLHLWKSEMEAKGLRVNMGKTKVMLSGPNLNSLRDSNTHVVCVEKVLVGTPYIV